MAHTLPTWSAAPIQGVLAAKMWISAASSNTTKLGVHNLHMFLEA
jgi:hypothetical protein